MLYVTTRSSREQYPALRTLGQNAGPDGGAYVPYRPARFQMKEENFGGCMAQTLNTLFLPGLTGPKVDFTVGKAPVRLHLMNHRIAVAECWHNPGGSLDWLTLELLRLVYPQGRLETASEWGKIAVRIGVIFGALQQLVTAGFADEAHPVDVAVPTADFSWPMAAWYARRMGLPVGTVICAGQESGVLWDLLQRGELRTRTSDSGQQRLLRGMERLICACLGPEEARRYGEIRQRRGIYAPEPEGQELLQQGLFAAVISDKRMKQVIASVYRTNQFVLSPEAALAYAGLQDCRASETETRQSLVLMPGGPVSAPAAQALGLQEEELRRRLDLN